MYYILISENVLMEDIDQLIIERITIHFSTFLKNDYNIYFSYDDLRDLINSNHNLGRPDVARLLMKNGYAKTVQEAFLPPEYIAMIISPLGSKVSPSVKYLLKESVKTI